MALKNLRKTLMVRFVFGTKRKKVVFQRFSMIGNDSMVLPRTRQVNAEITIMILACILMLIINVFSFRISSFILVLAATVISLAYFFIRQYLEKAGSER